MLLPVRIIKQPRKGGIKEKMKIRKLSKNAKALSPVVASIILIAVTVAVSIAVAAWMAGLIPMFSSTEQVQITNMEFVTGASPNGHIYVTVNNTGSANVIINDCWVNNVKATLVNEKDTGNAFPLSWSANLGRIVNINQTVVSGYTYQVKLISSKGNQFFYSATCP